MPQYEFFITHSLEKVFAHKRPAAVSHDFKLSALLGDRVSFQIVYTCTDGHNGAAWQPFTLSVEGSPAPVQLRNVELIPGQYPCWAGRDKNYLTTQPGLFPDLLTPSTGRVAPIDSQYRSLWVDIPLDKVKAGSYTLTVKSVADTTYLMSNGVTIDCSAASAWNWQQDITLEIINKQLPPQTLLHTEWFHADCLANYYHVAALGDEHWRIMENFIRFAGQQAGVNMLLTPIFTPPLDTQVGGERTTVQLVNIEKNGSRYSFDFAQLGRWCDLCRKYKISHLELAHFFTQWGAYATPKIIATVDGCEKRIFGWDVPATSLEYRAFLEAFVPQLIEYLHGKGYTREQLRFHISDEPNEEHMDSYLAAKKQIEDLLDGYIVMDALSSYEFYKRELVSHPIPANDHIQPFIDNGVPDLWVYYCCAQSDHVPNRFFAMPSARNRIMGVLMYLYDIKGFLHWGYNFYNSQFSRRAIDPYRVSDCEFAFPSGDPYLVYPAPGGDVYSSIRNEVQMEGYADMRALALLQSLTDRNFVENLIHHDLDYKLTFKQYPEGADYLLHLRRRVNEEIAKRV
ncbi:DUF4091 domain-containing protein [Hydrogenoanaerobacterium sp.]|uniref:DUF4091 domain-containing protein n=1 Tax=Hydrogenoanaerobacterium sp. TaxID=2953763 RepID=UPI00289D679C|nr:DUF4091 domain-containing protein [Hydrogenoanaerobacterium sp.]